MPQLYKLFVPRAKAKLPKPELTKLKFSSNTGADTCTGLDVAIVLPRPNCPTVLSPQAYNAPVLVMPNELSALSETADHELEPICTGELIIVVVELLPSWPLTPIPQPQSAPPVVMAMVQLLYETDTTLHELVPICTGLDEPGLR